MTDRVPELAHAGCQRSSQGQALSQKAEQNFTALNECGINGFPLGLDINMQLVFYRVQLPRCYDYHCWVPAAVIAGREDFSLFSLMLRINAGHTRG